MMRADTTLALAFALVVSAVSAVIAPSLVLAATSDDGAPPAAPTATGGDPAALPPFGVADADLLAFARQLHAGSDVDGIRILLESHDFTYAESGAVSSLVHRVYYIPPGAVVDGWDTSAVEWAPWYQSTPEISARVITAAGASYWLDPSTIAQQPVQSPDGILTDRLQLVTPLPQMSPDCVVEELIRVDDTVPFFDAGTVNRIFVQSMVPTHAFRVRVTHPEALHLEHRAHNIDRSSIDRKRRDDTVTIELVTSLDGIDDFARLMYDSSIGELPWLAFATGRSWSMVGNRYAEIVRGQLEGFEPDAAVVRAARAQSDPVAAAQVCLDWMREQVRYTGLEFGEAAIVPYAPSVVLEHGYGDCKDQATLLVGMLRAADQPAHVALLSVAERYYPSDLPGLGLFDHAIVHVASDPPVWIDPTDPLVRAGELPGPDQGVPVLIVGSDRDALLTTPLSTSAQNRIEELREIHMPLSGGASVSETTTATGEPERYLRYSFRGMTADQLRESGAEYMAGTYVTEELTDVVISDVEDPRVPFSLRYEATDAALAATGETDAGVAIIPSVLFGYLPFDDTWMDEDANPDRDLVMSWPYSYHVRYRIVPPPGFAVLDLPVPRDQSFGPATYRTAFAVEADESVTANLTFDSGSDRIPAADARELFDEIQQTSVIFIGFEQVGESYLAAGLVEEALAEFRALENDDPDDTLTQLRIVRALLAAGLGEAARLRAERVADANPDCPTAYRALAVAAAHDVVGRFLTEGADVGRAREAIARSRELDPDGEEAQILEAQLLEYDDEGVRYTTIEDLEPAFARYLELRETLDNTAIDTQLLELYTLTGQFDRVRAFGEDVDDATPGKLLYLCVAKAVTVGASAAIRSASARVTGVTLGQLLTSAGSWLMRFERFPEASAFFRAAATHLERSTTDLIALADALVSIDRHRERRASDPVLDAIGAFMTTSLDPASDADDLRRHMSKITRKYRREPSDIDAADSAPSRWMLAQHPISPDVIADAIFSLLDFSVTGDDRSGYVASAANESQTWYVVREDDDYPLLGTMTPGDRSLLAVAALEALDDGEIDVARTWLDRAHESVIDFTSAEMLDRPLFGLVWEPDVAAGEDTVRFAAACALVEDPDTAEFGKKVLERVTDIDVDPKLTRLARVRLALTLERFDDAVEIAEEIYAEDRESGPALSLLALALVSADESERAEAIVAEFRERRPSEVRSLRVALDLALDQKDFATADELGEKLLDTSEHLSIDVNNATWAAICNERFPPDYLRQLESAVARWPSPESAHTLAVFYAETARARQARDLALSWMARESVREPHDELWYVFARIAEHYDEIEAARLGYERVVDADVASSRLARRRLAALE